MVLQLWIQARAFPWLICRTLLTCFICLDLGDGWVPAVFDSECELAFIRERQEGFSDTRNFFIGGSTDDCSSRIAFADYYTTETGN